MKLSLAALCALLLAIPPAALGEEPGSPPAKVEKEQDRKKKDDKNDFDARADLYVLWAVSDALDEPANEFSFTRARAGLRWRYDRLLEAKLQVELSEFSTDGADLDLLRDAYLAVGDPVRWHARVTAGQFKRPFSRTELFSFRRLPTVGRGITNDWIVRELVYGSRDIGVMVDGRAGAGEWFGYGVGVFNGPGRNAAEAGLDGSKDVAARLDFKPSEWIELGVNTSLKVFDRGEGPDVPRFSWMAGLDVLFRGGKWVQVLGEGLVGEAWVLPGRPLTWSALLMVSSDAIRLGFWKARLEPLVKAELLVRDAGSMDTAVWMIQPGVNLHLFKRFRLMVQGEFLLPGTDEATRLEIPERMRLLVQLALDL